MPNDSLIKIQTKYACTCAERQWILRFFEVRVAILL